MKLRNGQHQVVLDATKHQVYDAIWEVRDATAQLSEVLSQTREARIQLCNVFFELGDAQFSC